MMTSTAPAAARATTQPRQRTSWIPRTRRQKHNLKWGLIFTSPAIVGLLVFTLAPVITSLVNSLTNVSLIGGSSRFVGFENYRQLLSDSSWWMSLSNTAILAIAAVPLGLLVALGLALMLNMRVRGLSIYRVIFFLPSIVPIVAAAVVWSYVLNPQYGVLNNLLDAVGIQGARVAQRPGLVQARADPVRAVGRRQPHDHPVGRPAGGAGRTQGAGHDRRRRSLGTIPERHGALHQPAPALRAGHGADRRVPVLHAGIRAHRRER